MQQSVALGINPRRQVSLAEIAVRQIFDVAADQAVKTVLHSFPGEVADAAKSEAGRNSVYGTASALVEQPISNRSGQLVDSTRILRVCQGENTVIEQGCPIVAEISRDDDLLGTKVIN